MELETPVVVRGFSNTFVPDKKVDVIDLQFIEGGELERTWKAARRQRLKQQEEKIWNEFVKEQDVLKSILSEDPYQFIDQLPEEELKELMETELSRMKDDLMEQKRGAGDSPRRDSPHAVTFSEIERDDVFQIFDDDNNDSGGEENCNDTLESPCTVRERDKASAAEHSAKVTTVGRASGVSVCPSVVATARNSVENVATVIESSIYCAKVKDLRIKIVNEIQNMIVSLENQNIASIDPYTLRKMCRRAAEYCARFQRIHLYQITRQVNDIKRHNSMATPYAKHTQFQSQMVRIVALHQSNLQALQVFHKSFEQTACLRECATQLHALCGAVRDSTAASRDVPVPADLVAATQLYSDNVVTVCEALENATKAYTFRVNEYIAAAENNHTDRSKKSGKNKFKKRSIGLWSQKATKNTSITEANARLSMYSLDTLRLNRKGTSKFNIGNGLEESARKDKKGKNDTPKSHRKSARRPLMRDPHSGRQRRPPPARPAPTADIQTMVQNVDPPSSQISRETSPTSSRRTDTPRKRQFAQSPRLTAPVPPIPINPVKVPPIPINPVKVPPNPVNPGKVPPTSINPGKIVPPIQITPLRPGLPPLPVRSAKNPRSRPMPASKNSPRVPMKNTKRVNPYMRSTPNNLNIETKGNVASTIPVTTHEPITPVSKIQCAKKEARPVSDIDIATMISDCRIENNDSSRCETFRVCKDGAKSCLDSTRTEASRMEGKERSQSGKSEQARNQNPEQEKTCEVSKILKQLCGGDTAGAPNKSERIAPAAKNAQLVCVTSISPRQPTTPQLLRILEETIQKKIPNHLLKPKVKESDKLRLAFNIPQQIAENLFQYRTKYVQHMLTSSMYANSVVGKPWEMIGSVSELIIEDVLAKCIEDMQIEPVISDLYESETK